MTATYDLIASSVLGSSAASVTFSSIPSTYRDLIVVVNVDSDAHGHKLAHGGATANDAAIWAWGDGSTTGSSSATNVNMTSYYQARQVIWQIMDYSATDKHKPIIWRASGPADAVVMAAGRWAFTTAVTSITIESADTNYPAGTSFYVYGIVS